MTEQESCLELNQWPTIPEYEVLKRDFLLENEVKNLELLEDPDFSNGLNEPQVVFGAKLLSLFDFGREMVFRKIGQMQYKQNFVIKIRVMGRSNSFAGYDSIGSTHINLDRFREILDDWKGGKNSFNNLAGVMQKVSYEDGFEIAGVEEVAHLVFHREKGHMGADGLSSDFPVVERFSPEAERRAMIWKLGYLKRYMPQYYGSLKDTYKLVLEH